MLLEEVVEMLHDDSIYCHGNQVAQRQRAEDEREMITKPDGFLMQSH